MTTTDIHFITHNFGDWDSDTKHMTRNQRAIYLDLCTLYFSTAQKSSGSLTMDFDLLCFKMGCRTDSDCIELKWLLKDKFKIINKKYRHTTWDEQIKISDLLCVTRLKKVTLQVTQVTEAVTRHVTKVTLHVTLKFMTILMVM